MVTTIAKSITVEDYLAQEENAEEKSEFIQGEIIKMAGASANHNLLTGKLHGEQVSFVRTNILKSSTVGWAKPEKPLKPSGKLCALPTLPTVVLMN